MKIKLSKTQWQEIGKKTGWMKIAQSEEPAKEISVARTILQQLGGNKFAVMTGAKSFMDVGNGLSFKLPGSGGFTKDGINYVKITLNSMDTYDIEFGRIRGNKYTIITEKSNIYNDQLQEIFRDVTGLNTSL